MTEMRRHSPHELGTIRIPLNSPMRRVWMAGFNFLVSKKGEWTVSPKRQRFSSLLYNTQDGMGKIWLVPHYFLLFCLALSYPTSWGLAFSENHTKSGTNAACDALLTWHMISRVSFAPTHLAWECRSHVLTSPRSPRSLMSTCVYNCAHSFY